MNLKFLIFINLFKLFLCQNNYVVEPVKLEESLYPEWAHYHWIWLSFSDGTQENLTQLYKDYQSYDIPVGAINIDSSWPEKFQNFIWNATNFPNPSQMIDYFHSENVKVLCWITSTINNDSTNFIEGKQKGYYLSDGKTVDWRHGYGAFIDYTNPNALDWWHQQMDNILSLGIDGWKVDGVDPFVWFLKDSYGYKGHISEREYADLYYRDFYYYTKKKRGDDVLIMARPVDNVDQLLYLEYAPRDVMFSGWVGDQDGTWSGLKVALVNIIHSAWKNYLNFGSDIGGYRAVNTPLGRDKEVFIRWFQLGAFLSLMENGGMGEHRPWIFGKDVADNYRVFANIHTNLAPFFLNAGTQCYGLNVSVIKPLAKKDPFGSPSTYDYVLFDDIFVSPIVENSTYKNITFPGKSNEYWSYWFNNSLVFQGGAKIKSFNCPFSEYPAFVKVGSVLPLKVENSYTGFGSKLSKNYFTLYLNKPLHGIHKKNIHEFKSNGFQVVYDLNETKASLDIYISAHQKHKFILVIDGLNENFYKFYLKSYKSLDEFKIIQEKSNEYEFWNDLDNSVFKIKDKNRLFIKINDNALKGLHVKLIKDE